MCEHIPRFALEDHKNVCRKALLVLPLKNEKVLGYICEFHKQID